MGKRGPRADPVKQAAMGHPGRRRSKVQQQADQAERLVKLLAAAPTTGAMEPPLLQDPLFAPALEVWRDLAPRLSSTHRLPKESRTIFVQLCVYAAEWLAAELDIAANGYSQRVKTVAGGFMERKRPVVDRRERAFDNVLKLSERFGLTPHDIYTLFKEQSVAAERNPWLFGDEAKPAGDAPAAAAPETPATGGLVGSMSRLDSPPPGPLN